MWMAWISHHHPFPNLIFVWILEFFSYKNDTTNLPCSCPSCCMGHLPVIKPPPLARCCSQRFCPSLLSLGSPQRLGRCKLQVWVVCTKYMAWDKKDVGVPIFDCGLPALQAMSWSSQAKNNWSGHHLTGESCPASKGVEPCLLCLLHGQQADLFTTGEGHFSLSSWV